MLAHGAWKLVEGLHATVDRFGGYRRIERRGQAWAERLAGRVGGDLGRWPNRVGAGELWVPAASAPEWARDTCTAADLALADASVAGTFDLLGSGPVQLGMEPEWRRDLYSGLVWPLEPGHRLRIVRGDGSDVRTVWELGRAYHFVALARAYWTTARPVYRDAFTRHVLGWLQQNPVGFGPNWTSPMDAAIRAANWSLAAVLFARAAGVQPEFWTRLFGNLHATGTFIERYLEWHPVYRGNHYVADAVGLVYLGALFRGDRDGERWIRRGAKILEEEIRRQVHSDGVGFEGSLAYHRLVTELFAYGAEVLNRNPPHCVSADYETRLRQMYAFIASYLPESEEAPMLGDADDGRLHAVSAEGLLAPRRHRLGLPERNWPDHPSGSAAFPQGGFYVLRRGTHHAVVRCGPIGVRGAGPHDHNDQLAFELVLNGRRVLADSGTFTYTRDLQARLAFRATAAHGVIQLEEEEQNPIRSDRPWRVLEHRTHAECVRWHIGERYGLFSGRHFGFSHRASVAVCHREILLADDGCRLLDQIEGAGAERLTWRLHFGPGDLRLLGSTSAGATLLFSGHPPVRVQLRFPGSLALRIGASPCSDVYGHRYSRPSLELAGESRLPLVVQADFEPLDLAPI